MLWNPFKREYYRLRTVLSPQEALKGLLKGMDAYNGPTRDRCMMVSGSGEQFRVIIEPLTFERRGTGQWMRQFVVEAKGEYLPQLDGTVEVQVRFKRSTSLFQIIWRLLFLLWLASVPVLLRGPVIFVFATFLPLVLAPVVIPWSTVAYFLGMRQAGRDWEKLVEAIRTGMGSHAFETV